MARRTVTITPRQQQAMALLRDAQTRELVYGGAAGGGKSRLGCMWLIEMCCTHPGARYLMGRAVLQRLRETTLKTLYATLSDYGLDRGRYWNMNLQTSTLTFWNGSEIVMKDLADYPSDPEFDSLGSLELTGAFVDEAAEISAKCRAVLATRIRYRVDEFGLIPKILWTCNPSKNWTYTEFYKPAAAGTLAPGRAFVQALAGDNPHLPSSYAAQFDGLPASVRRRLLKGEWEVQDDDMALFKYDDLQAMFDSARAQGGRAWVTVDVARMGSDRTCVVAWDGMRATEVHLLSRSSTDDTAAFVRALAHRVGADASSIIVDTDGVGGGVADQLRGCRQFLNGSSALNGENFANLKSQCYFALADAVARGEASVACDPLLRPGIVEELEAVRRLATADVRRQAVEPKDRIKAAIGRSPDVADALMMRMLPVVAARRRSSGYDSVAAVSW